MFKNRMLLCTSHRTVGDVRHSACTGSHGIKELRRKHAYTT